MPWLPPGGGLLPGAFGSFGAAHFVALPVLGASVGDAGSFPWRLVLWLLAGEALAALGVLAGASLEVFSRPNLLERARERGRAGGAESLLASVTRLEWTARLVRFAGSGLVILALAWAVLGADLSAGKAPSAPSVLGALALALGAPFLLNDVLLRGLARKAPESVLLRVGGPLRVLSRATALLRVPVLLLLRSILGVRLDADVPTAREELRESVDEGEREGAFTAAEAEMIGSIIDFKALTVGDIATPRADVVMISSETPLSEAVEVVTRSGFSRIPIYGRDRDDVVGILYARDLLVRWPVHAPPATQETVKSFMRKPLFVPETKSLTALLEEMRSRQVHAAVVLDAYNGTRGMVTIEDLIEEIVGDIRDEYDQNDEAASPLKPGEPLEVEGRASIEALNRLHRLDLPLEEEYETVGGLVFHRLGKVPAAGDRVRLKDVALTVLEADERTIRRLQIEVNA